MASSAEVSLREDLVTACKILYAVKAAGDGLRAASVSKLPVLTAEAKAAVMQARKAAVPGGGESRNQERWQMLQDYYLTHKGRRGASR